MADAIPARLTPREGRRFGLTVGTAFLILCAVLQWRGHGWAVAATAFIGGGLILGGLAAPDKMGPIHRGWMGLAHLLSKVTTPIFMGIVYFLVLTPVGLVLRVMARRPLSRNATIEGYWIDRSKDAARRGSMERQF